MAGAYGGPLRKCCDSRERMFHVFDCPEVLKLPVDEQVLTGDYWRFYRRMEQMALEAGMRIKQGAS